MKWLIPLFVLIILHITVPLVMSPDPNIGILIPNAPWMNFYTVNGTMSQSDIQSTLNQSDTIDSLSNPNPFSIISSSLNLVYKTINNVLNAPGMLINLGTWIFPTASTEIGLIVGMMYTCLLFLTVMGLIMFARGMSD
jgi:hypothetical protein